MAIVQTVMWTAVPNGIDTATGKLKVRCVVSPRLSSLPETNQTLGVYANWPQWTAYVAAPAFALSLQVGGVTHANLVPDKTVLKPNLWPALFPGSMLVRPFKVADLTGKLIRSYPVGNVVEAIRKLYSDMTNERPEDQGPHGRAWSENRSLVRDLQLPRNSERTILATVNGLYAGGKRALPPAAPQPLTDFLQVLRFHWTPAAAQAVPQKAFADDTLDFHQVVSLLMEYPILQRHLGLVLDFLVPVGSLLPGDTTVKVVPPSAGHLTPTTAATFGTGSFWPKAAGDIADNRLALSGAAFSVVTIDVDGAAIKLRQFADNMKHVQTGDEQFLPSLRSAGLAVARKGNAWLYNTKFGQAKQDNATIVGGGNVVLNAASLLHGLRWQAYDVAAQRWFSLCERDVMYHFLALGDTPGAYVPAKDSTLREEGAVTAATTQRVNDGTDDLYLAEYLARWHGENLAAPRPGLSLLEPGQPLGDPDPGPQKPTDPQLKVTTRPASQGLPVLRFGRDYRLRALASYLGGAGVPFQRGDTSSDFTYATGVGRYARAEPVPAPEVVMCAPPTPGETITDLVIRTEYDSAPDPAQVCARHLLPPKAAQLFAEQLGMFDTDTGFKPNIYPILAQRANGVLSQQTYPSDTNLDVPWLPDVYARGVSLSGFHTIDFGYAADSENWQTVKGVQIRLIEGSGLPEPLPGVNGLLLKLGKGDVVEFPLSSCLSADHLDNLQIWRWFKEITAGNPQHKKSATDPYGYYVDWAKAGLIAMLTPKRLLRLICAVRQPLLAPASLGSADIVHQQGQNHVTLAWKVACSRKSTVSLDMTASWSDIADVWTGTKWETQITAKSADLGEVPVDPAQPEGELDLSTLAGGGVRSDFHDTKAHWVAYRTRAKSRFAEYFTERAAKEVTPVGETPIVVNSRGIAEDSEIVTAPNGGTTFVRNQDYVVNYETGTLARKPGSPISGQVNVDFLPSITRSDTLSTWVNSRSRPAAPVPVQVLPTFGWQTQTPSSDPDLPGAVLSRRSGNGLRIYYAPPWHSSGEGEKLGVVFANAPGILEHLRPYVTAWAGDPAVADGSLPAPVPQPFHVLSNPVVSGPVVLAELPGMAPASKQVRVVQLTPLWDGQRQLYYSDIEFASGSAYFPFIRLALCRYQPHSMAGIEMSPVRLADFAQLAPDRWVSLAYPSPTEVDVTVVGHSYLGTYSSSMRGGNVVVTVERRDPGIDSAELGWSAAGTTQLTPGVAWVKDGNKTMWTGKVSLPAPHSSEFRLVIQESERWPGGERHVFTDVIALS
ncbi:hypothetical protein Rhe02_00170 [Rhizocola hellebori]|uniref:Uncharacterized protein n=1 Tax=Rhizocola hellebori TaxID=1392758 RepID=A0A8J3Q1D1_9ACTN|nr:hypothetical protein [Rhizocola hellebori]GIH01950.1 hypothetical protein Rhe02_00170 [Rhizocola hellebori]